MSDADNLIYNRFDIIFPDSYGEFSITRDKDIYRIQFAIDEEGRASLNVWGRKLPTDVFEDAVEYVFDKLNIKEIWINSSRNNYKGQLVKYGDVKILIPDDWGELQGRLGKKGRYNLNRERRRIKGLFEGFDVLHEHIIISNNTVWKYFEWKMTTHGTDYHMSPEQYLKTYHVTDALRLVGDGRDIAILFYCMCEGTAYLENFSYDVEYRKYSPGFVIYTYFLEKMVRDGCTSIFLGKSGLSYKERFGSVVNECFEGTIYRTDVFQHINEYLMQRNLKSIAIYGMGKCGREFLQISKYLDIDIMFVIDQVKQKIDMFNVYTPDELKTVKDIDLIIICMERRSINVENRIVQWKCKYLYFNELMDIGRSKTE